jgi:HlyD family secretion protein
MIESHLTELVPRAEVIGTPAAEAPAVAPTFASTAPVRRPAPGPRRRRRTLIRWVVAGVVVAAIGAAVVLAWMPKPVSADLATAAVGPLTVTVDEDGRTRVKDRYVVSAPLAGTLARILLRSGDSVHRGEVVARVIPPAAPLLDPRSRAEAQARVSAAQATLRQAETAATRARDAADFARRDAERQRALLGAGAAAPQTVEQVELTERLRAEELASAEFGLRVAESELRLAEAALQRLSHEGPQEEFTVRAPVAGRVLRVAQESEAAVQAGATLLEIGDPRALEVVVDVLSSDAVEIRPGAPVRIERWGGDSLLHGRVRLIEPSAFTRVSSLGIEEQRVNVVVDLIEPPAGWATLGDGYRVEARIVVWQAPEVLRVPTGAIFRHGEGWAVYTVARGSAHLRPISIGRRNGEWAQILDGLEAGELVVTYPSDDVADGVRITAR